MALFRLPPPFLVRLSPRDARKTLIRVFDGDEHKNASKDEPIS